MHIDWTQITAAAAVGAGIIWGWKQYKSSGDVSQAQTEAIAVDTLREVILELRTELDRVRGRLVYAERLVEDLTGERLPDNLLGF